MIDYTSINEVMDNTDNMEVKFKNSRSDDGTFIYDVSPIFSYNGKKVSKLYVSANSWIGFNDNFNLIKINNRDGQIIDFYLQEGQIFGKYKFLKFRWRGYSHFSYTDGCSLQYELFLIDTGDIFIHMVDVPRNYFTKSYIHDGKKYIEIPISDSSRNIIIRQTKDGLKIEEGILKLKPPFMCKYLIGDENGIYTVENNSLKSLVGELNSDCFIKYGMDELPDKKHLVNLINPSIYYWQDSNTKMPTMELVVNAIPNDQTVITEDYNMVDETIKGIEKIYVDASDNIKIAISKDGGKSYYIFQNNAWLKTSEENTGMSKIVLEEINTERLNEFFNVKRYRFKIILTEASYFKSIKVDYLN